MLEAELIGGDLVVTRPAWGNFALRVKAGALSAKCLDAPNRRELHAVLGIHTRNGGQIPRLVSHLIWSAMPYGIGALEPDGSRVAFHREYRPVARIYADGSSEPIWDADAGGMDPAFWLYSGADLAGFQTRRVVAALGAALGVLDVAEHHAAFDRRLHGRPETSAWFEKNRPAVFRTAHYASAINVGDDA